MHTFFSLITKLVLRAVQNSRVPVALQDFDMSPFECARKLLDGSQASLSLSQKMDLVFQDMDLVPLLIQENYVNHKPNLGVAEEQHMRVRA